MIYFILFIHECFFYISDIKNNNIYIYIYHLYKYLFIVYFEFDFTVKPLE